MPHVIANFAAVEKATARSGEATEATLHQLEDIRVFTDDIGHTRVGMSCWF
ncbi:MAG: hypothetical protein ACHQ1H_05650 [Nitrososphaerales archaeon]